MYLNIPISDNKSITYYKEFNYPILITNGCSDMLAIKKWNTTYLKEKFQKNKFEIQYYNDIQDSETTGINHIEWMTFGDFINISHKTRPHLYLAGRSLERHKDNISEDIFKDIFIKTDKYRKPTANLLFVGHNSKSGNHIHAEEDYSINQIYGKKTVYLYDYYDNNLKLKPVDDPQYNFTEKNLFKLDHKLYKIYKVTLVPGNTLLIPPWWFHAVECNGVSYSITKTFSRPFNYLLKRPNILFILSYRFILDYKLYVLVIIFIFVILYIIYKNK